MSTFCVVKGISLETGYFAVPSLQVFYGEKGADYKKPDRRNQLQNLYHKHMFCLTGDGGGEEIPPEVEWDTSTLVTVDTNWFMEFRVFGQ